MVSTSLVKKLDPRRFPGMSGKMVAIVGYILDKDWSNPRIEDMSVSSGAVFAQQAGDIGYNDYIGSVDDLRSNLSRLAVAAGLTGDEIEELHQLYGKKVEDWDVGGRRHITR